VAKAFCYDQKWPSHDFGDVEGLGEGVWGFTAASIVPWVQKGTAQVLCPEVGGRGGGGGARWPSVSQGQHGAVGASGPLYTTMTRDGCVHGLEEVGRGGR
jgi:hypothetical protein